MTKSPVQGTPSLRDRFKAATGKVHQSMTEAKDIGGIAADGQINGNRAGLELVAKFNKKGEEAEMLKVLRTADKRVIEDPFARRVFLAERLKTLATSDEVVTGGMVSKLIAEAMSDRMPDGTSAIPVLEKTTNKNQPAISLPRVEYHNGRLRTAGTVHYSSRIDNVIAAIEALRMSALSHELNDVVDFRLVNLKELVEQLVPLVPGGIVVSAENAQKRCADGSYLKFELTSNELFLVPSRLGYAEQMCDCLNEAKRAMNAILFEEEQYDIVSLMRQRINGAGGTLISRREFLGELYGFAAVTHPSWKKDKAGDEKIVTNMLIERHPTFGWRVVVADYPTVRALLHGGRLSFTSWSTEELPPHIVANIRSGDDINNL